MLALAQIYAILRNTLLETVRQPVYGLVLALSAAMIALTPATAAHVYSFRVTTDLERVAERMVADLGLATILLAGLILGVFMSTGAVSRELDDRTAGTILVKNVSRSAFVLGKYLGVAVGIVCATLTGSMITLLTVRAGAPVAAWERLDWGIVGAMILAALVAVGTATWRNYSRGRAWIGSFNLTFMALVFAVFLVFSVIDKEYQFILQPGYQPSASALIAETNWSPTYDWQIARAACLTIQAVLVVASIAVTASTRLNTIGTSCVTGCFVLFGLTSDFTRDTLINLRWGAAVDAFAGVLYMIVPNLEKFWMSDALTREQPIPFEYLAATTGYAALYVIAMILIACYLLQNRDVS